MFVWHRRPLRADRGVFVYLLLAAVLSFAVSQLVAGRDNAKAAGPEAIANAPDLNWGFKKSWRLYAPTPAVSGGATVIPGSGNEPYDITWDFDSGSYDADTGTTIVKYKGSTHWQKYKASQMGFSAPPGYSGEPDPYILDVTLSDPTITIGPDGSSVSVLAQSRQASTWELLDMGRVNVVQLDPSAISPAVDAGTTTWAGVPASVTEQGTPAFGGNYQPGVNVDEVGFSYTGPGGAPDLSDDFDAQGSAKLELAHNEILSTDPDADFDPWWIDRKNLIVHYKTVSADGQMTFQAFDLATMGKVGTPLTVPAFNMLPTNVADPETGRVLYTASGDTTTHRYIRYDRNTGTYSLGELDYPLPLGSNGGPLNWDPVNDRVYQIGRSIPDGVDHDDYDNHQWRIRTFTEQSDGSWATDDYNLPSFEAGHNETGYAAQSTLKQPTSIVAADGSIVALGTQRETLNEDGDPPEIPEPATVPAAWQIELTGDDANATPIPGTDIPNRYGSTFRTLHPGPDGEITMSRQGATTVLWNIRVAADGQASSDNPITVTGSDSWATQPDAIAVDPTDGMIWVGGYQSQRVWGVKDGEVVANVRLGDRHPRGGPVIVGSDHTVYAQTNDGSPPVVGGSPIYGFGKFTRLGFTPTVSAQPGNQAVSLASEEESKSVAFTSNVTGGEPASTRKWQVKAAGSTIFRDVSGETGATLNVDAKRGMDGTQYRAVYENAAGRVASDVATLAVKYAPRALSDLPNVTVEEGTDAVLLVNSDGNPEPTVQWQRRVGGFWETIDQGDENFVVNGPSLTVKETNLDQSGTLFRAKLTNSVESVYSRSAELTITANASIPPGGVDLDHVTLDWTGSAELQKAPPFGGSNFFSAGVSDGNQPTYSAASGNARVLQVSASGAESLATWETRAAHVANGGQQLVRLTNGHAEIEADGSALVNWDGDFSVNFYGGLVPFTVSDPVLAIDEDGDGTLKGDLSGYAASMANPNDRTPIPPVEDVTIATFSDVEVDPDGELEVQPDYAGVEVEIPSGATQQNRSVAGWGAWPQAFVDFQLDTGLSSYWYSSGGAADAYKSPKPFLVGFDGSKNTPLALPDTKPQPQPQPQPQKQIATLTPLKGTRSVDSKRLVSIATLKCPADGLCRVTAPKRVRVKIAGKTYTLTVIAPKSIGPGKQVTVTVRLTKAAVRALKGKAKLKLKLTISQLGIETTKTLSVSIKARKSS